METKMPRHLGPLSPPEPPHLLIQGSGRWTHKKEVLQRLGRHDASRIQSKLQEFEQDGQGTKATRNCWLSHRSLYDERVRGLPMASMKNTF